MLERKVLLATDLTGDVRAGLRFAGQIARERAATLVILHVVPMGVQEGASVLHRSLDVTSGQVQRQLTRLSPQVPGVSFRHVLEFGDPEVCLRRFIEREGIELLVMESRPRSLLRRFMKASLLERLMGQVPCPLMVYREGAQNLENAPAVGEPLSIADASPSVESLTTMLNARVDALIDWMSSQRGAVLRIAERPSVRDAVQSLFRAREYGVGGTFAPRIRDMLKLELYEHQQALGALAVQLSYRGVSLLDHNPELEISHDASSDRALARFTEKLDAQGAAVSAPLGAGEAGLGGSVVLAGAQVKLTDDEAARLVFVFDARKDFFRILGQPALAPSAETYAFDDLGVMLSNSRFPDELRRLGLLPQEPEAQTPHRLRLCDPGGDSPTARLGVGAELPLTRMAAAATRGEDGSDWRGYRDYRGVDVVGAWRWLGDCGFGVAAEMDCAIVRGGRGSRALGLFEAWSGRVTA